MYYGIRLPTNSRQVSLQTWTLGFACILECPIDRPAACGIVGMLSQTVKGRQTVGPTTAPTNPCAQAKHLANPGTSIAKTSNLNPKNTLVLEPPNERKTLGPHVEHPSIIIICGLWPIKPLQGHLILNGPVFAFFGSLTPFGPGSCGYRKFYSSKAHGARRA